MLRGIGKFFRGIKPKSKPLIYDYTYTELDNPNRPIDDDTIPKKDEKILSSAHVYFAIYCVAGYWVFFFTKLHYDKEWDRWYHVNYPAPMEYFDKISRYFIVKTERIIESLPASVDEIYQKQKNALTKSMPKTIKTLDKEVSIGLETKIGEQMSALINDQVKPKQPPHLPSD